MLFWKCRTAIRLRSACLAMLYRKVIRLNSLGGKSVGEVSIQIIYITNPLEVDPEGSVLLIINSCTHHPDTFLSTSSFCSLFP